MALTDYVTLGRSGLRVSPICLGTMTFGMDWGFGSDEEGSAEVMNTYLEAGGNFLDTANVYTKGHSEKFIGDFFASRTRSASNCPRDRVVIATKFMGNLYRGDPNGGGGGRKAVVAACEESLRRLQTDYIDLYWAHFMDPHTPIEETVRAMDNLVRDGKVRYIGFSDHPAWVCAKAQEVLRELQGSPLVALQIEYSLAQRSVEADLIPMAVHYGMGVTPWSPLRGGLLTGKYTRDSQPNEDTRIKEDSPHLNEKNFAIIDALLETAMECTLEDGSQATPAQVAIAWLLDQPAVASPIVGARKMSQLKDNLKALELSLSNEQHQRLADVSAVEHAFPHGFLQNAPTLIQGGTTVNGEVRDCWNLSPANDSERY